VIVAVVAVVAVEAARERERERERESEREMVREELGLVGEVRQKSRGDRNRIQRGREKKRRPAPRE
jgi:hypothetical protein